MQCHTVPAWMLEECRYDSYEHTREAARQYSEQGGA